MQSQSINAAKLGELHRSLRKDSDGAAPRNAFPDSETESEGGGQFPAPETRLYADAHVVARDGVDEGRGDFPQQNRQAGAEGFVDEEGVETAHPFAEFGELRVGEVVEEKVGDEGASVGRRGLGEEVALCPFHGKREMGGARGEIVGGDFGLRKFHGEAGEEVAFSRPDLGDVAGVFRDGGGDPELVAHEKVDSAEVGSGAHRAWVVVREVIEEFPGEFAHGGILGAAGDGRKYGNDECFT